jgi:hypothetical protein
VAYLPHAGAVEVQKPQNTHTTIDSLLSSATVAMLWLANTFEQERRSFLCGSARRLYNATLGVFTASSV